MLNKVKRCIRRVLKGKSTSTKKGSKKANNKKEELRKKRKREALAEKNEKSIKHIMERTGWTKEHTVATLKEAQKRTGCTYKEFLIYKFYELSEEEQNNVFVAHESLQIRDKFDTDPSFVEMLLDKEKTNIFFDEFVNRAWCVNTKVGLDDFKKTFANIDHVIYKPIHGNRGKGIEHFYMADDASIEKTYEDLKKLPEGVVEEYVVQHPELNGLCSASVNTIRIVTVSSKKKQVTPDGKHFDIAYAALRIGGGKSIVDNFHSGGMVAAVDLETGELVTDATDMDNNVFTTHPESGAKIKGFKIPYFKEALDMVVKACTEKGVEGYIGWDVAITEKGPVFIEVNIRPGVVLISMPWTIERKGMRSVMKKYLDA